MIWIVIALLLTCCEARKESLVERRYALELTLSALADHLGGVESSADFERAKEALAADYLDLARELIILDRLGAKAPLEQSVELLQVKERMHEHLERIREMEGGIEWLRSLQRPAHTLLVDIEA